MTLILKHKSGGSSEDSATARTAGENTTVADTSSTASGTGDSDISTPTPEAADNPSTTSAQLPIASNSDRFYTVNGEMYEKRRLYGYVDTYVDDYVRKLSPKELLRTKQAIDNLLEGFMNGTVRMTDRYGRFDTDNKEYQNSKHTKKDYYGWAANFLSKALMALTPYEEPEREEDISEKPSANVLTLLKDYRLAMLENLGYNIDDVFNDLDSENHTDYSERIETLLGLINSINIDEFLNLYDLRDNVSKNFKSRIDKLKEAINNKSVKNIKRELSTIFSTNEINNIFRSSNKTEGASTTGSPTTETTLTTGTSTTKITPTSESPSKSTLTSKEPSPIFFQYNYSSNNFQNFAEKYNSSQIHLDRLDLVKYLWDGGTTVEQRNSFLPYLAYVYYNKKGVDLFRKFGDKYIYKVIIKETNNKFTVRAIREKNNENLN